jgi:hypothetical protein
MCKRVMTKEGVSPNNYALKNYWSLRVFSAETYNHDQTLTLIRTGGGQHSPLTGYRYRENKLDQEQLPKVLRA